MVQSTPVHIIEKVMWLSAVYEAHVEAHQRQLHAEILTAIAESKDANELCQKVAAILQSKKS